MAKRASETIVTWAGGTGKQVFQKDQIVPDALAKKVDALVYDDGAPKKPAKKTASE